MKKINLSLIIITGNEQDMIADCLHSCNFADEFIMVSNSTDNTIDIAKKTIPSIKIFPHTPFNFSKSKNLAVSKSHGDWLLFVDADERITPELKSAIQKIISEESVSFTSYDFPRANYYLGHRVKHGGSYPDYVKRLIYRKSFHGFIGDLHEQPQVDGPSQKLTRDLLHYTHRDLTSMMAKSINWTRLEAEMLYQANHPPVVWWRFIRMMLTKFWERLIQQQMWRDGTVGWISVIFETFDTFMIYARLWELQQQKV